MTNTTIESGIFNWSLDPHVRRISSLKELVSDLQHWLFLPISKEMSRSEYNYDAPGILTVNLKSFSLPYLLEYIFTPLVAD